MADGARMSTSMQSPKHTYAAALEYAQHAHTHTRVNDLNHMWYTSPSNLVCSNTAQSAVSCCCTRTNLPCLPPEKQGKQQHPSSPPRASPWLGFTTTLLGTARGSGGAGGEGEEPRVTPVVTPFVTAVRMDGATAGGAARLEERPGYTPAGGAGRGGAAWAYTRAREGGGSLSEVATVSPGARGSGGDVREDSMPESASIFRRHSSASGSAATSGRASTIILSIRSIEEATCVARAFCIWEISAIWAIAAIFSRIAFSAAIGSSSSAIRAAATLYGPS